MTRWVWVFLPVVACTPAPGPIAPPTTPPTVAALETPEEPESPPTEAPVSPDENPVEKRESNWPVLGKTSGCETCLPSAEDRCESKRDFCTTAPACMTYLDCVARCPPPATRDPAGGYPQADCVIACRSKSEQAADLGDAYLWCVCCETSCGTACRGECGHFKSGIAGPIGAGCE